MFELGRYGDVVGDSREISSAVDGTEGEGVFLSDAELIDDESCGLSGCSDDVTLLDVCYAGPIGIVDRAIAFEPAGFVTKQAGGARTRILGVCPCKFERGFAVIDDFDFEVVDGVRSGGIDDDGVLKGCRFLVFFGHFDADFVFTFLEGDSLEIDVAESSGSIDEGFGLRLSVDGEVGRLSDFGVAGAGQAILDALGLRICVVCAGKVCGIVGVESRAFDELARKGGSALFFDGHFDGGGVGFEIAGGFEGVELEGVVLIFDEGNEEGDDAVVGFLDEFFSVEEQFDIRPVGGAGCGANGVLNAGGLGIFVATGGDFLSFKDVCKRDVVAASADLDFGFGAFTEILEWIFDGGFERVLKQGVDGSECDAERDFAAVDFVGSSEGKAVKEEVGITTIASVGGDIDLELKAIGLGVEVVGWAEELVVGGGVDHDGRCGVEDLEFDLILAAISGFVGDFGGEGDVSVGEGGFGKDGFSCKDGSRKGLRATFAVVEGDFNVFAGCGGGFDKDFDGFLEAGGFGIFVIFGAKHIAGDGFIDFDLEALRVDGDVESVGKVSLTVGGGELELEDVGPFGESIALEGEFGCGEVDFCGVSAVGGESDFAVFGGVFGFSSEGELKSGGLWIFVLLGIKVFLRDADELDGCGAGRRAATTVAGSGRTCEQGQAQPSQQGEALGYFFARDRH